MIFILGFICLNMSVSHQFWRWLLHSVNFYFHQDFWYFTSPAWNPTVVSSNHNFSRFSEFYGIYFLSSTASQGNYIVLIIVYWSLFWNVEFGKSERILCLSTFFFFLIHFLRYLMYYRFRAHAFFKFSWFPQNYSDLFYLRIYHVCVL